MGKQFLDAYRKHPRVEKARVIFVMDPAFDYRRVGKLLEQSEDMTMALDHLLQKVKMDCNACRLKEICAEVEALCGTDAQQIADTMASRYE